MMAETVGVQSLGLAEQGNGEGQCSYDDQAKGKNVPLRRDVEGRLPLDEGTRSLDEGEVSLNEEMRSLGLVEHRITDV